MSRRAGHERKNLKMLVKPKSFMKLNHRKDSEEWTESKEYIPLTVILRYETELWASEDYPRLGRFVRSK